MIAPSQLAAWLRAIAAEMTAHRDELTALDSAIGDADHGANMQRGFQAVLVRVDAEHLAEGDAGSLMKGTAMALISTVGGASGPLYGTFFLRFAAGLGGKHEVSPADFAAAFRAGLAGLQQRGKAEPGDKTMVDALTPASAALDEQIGAGSSLGTALSVAAEAARQGMLGTTPLIARKGRASYLGERSRGHQDPGATSAYLVVKAAAETLGPLDQE